MKLNAQGKEALEITLCNAARQRTCLPESYMNSENWHIYTDKPTEMEDLPKKVLKSDMRVFETKEVRSQMVLQMDGEKKRKKP